MKQKLRLHLALPALFFLFLLSACRREESLETGFTARYALQDTFGVCFTSNVVGTYRAGQVLGDSNYLELTLDVDVTGRYAINTDLQNGFSFTGTGAFTDTGMTTIRVPARGTPIAEGVTTLRLSQDSGYCEINVTVLGSNPANGGGSCNAVATGTFKKDTTLNASHAVSVQHNFATAGSYTVTTDTINGFYFNKAVTVVAPGTQSIILDGFGTPAAVGTNNFTVRFGDGSSCNFAINVVSGTSTGGGGCGTINGAYTVGNALTAANTFTTNTHQYAASGTYNVQVSSTAPGLTATTFAVTATSAGSSPSITVPLAGTPTAAGTYPVNIDFGDGSTCVLSVTVTGGSSAAASYFPLSLNSWWSYSDPADFNDTLRVDNVGTTVLNGVSYNMFIRTRESGFKDTSYYRRDASGIYYESVLLSKYGDMIALSFPAGARGEIPFVRDVLTTGQNWTSDEYTSNNGTKIRFFILCRNNNNGVSNNGHSFPSEVYDMQTTLQSSPSAGIWQSHMEVQSANYVKNVGLFGIVIPNPNFAQLLLNYHVN